MTIFTEPRVRQAYLEEIEAPLSDTLSVAAKEALLYSPTWSYIRNFELDAAEHGAPAGFLTPGAEWRDGGFRSGPPKTPLLTANDARARVKEAGLELDIPDAGIRKGALDILMERKRDELRRRDVLARGPAGMLPSAARFGAALGASLLDPLNVAAAFVPVVGEARYAALVARAGTAGGRAAVRAGVGALEGAAGAALVEPIVLSAATREQADYDLTDSLLNIALGTVLGGGLHVGVGAVADALKAGRPWQASRATEELPRALETLAPETREAALRTSVAQAVSGRTVDVEPVLEATRVGEYPRNDNLAVSDGLEFGQTGPDRGGLREGGVGPERDGGSAPGLRAPGAALPDLGTAHAGARGRPLAPEAIEDLRVAAQRSLAPDGVRLADFEAARAADEQIAPKAEGIDIDQPDAGLPEILEDITTLARGWGDEGLVARELAPYDGLVVMADEYGRAVKAAAACFARRV